MVAVRPGVCAMLALSTACGTAAPPAPPPGPPPPPPSVLVPQVGPGAEILHYGWLAEGRVAFVIAADAVFLWEPSAGRILDVHTLTSGYSSSEVLVGAAGLAYGPDVLRTDPFEWTRFESIYEDTVAPSLDRWARLMSSPNREVLLARPGHDDVRFGVDEVTLAFSPDGASIATCGAARFEIRDSATAAWQHGVDVPADGCEFSADGRLLFAYELALDAYPVVVRAIRVVDIAAGRVIGAPLTDVDRAIAASAAGPIVVATRGTREGFSVLDLETHAERAHVSIGGAEHLDVVGEFVVASGIEGGLFAIADGRRLRSGDLRPYHVAPDGRSLEVDGSGRAARLLVVGTSGAEIARLDLPALARIDASPGRLWAEGRALHHVDPSLAIRSMGDCPRIDGSESLFGGAHHLWAWLRAPPALVRHIAGSCIARDDGTSVLGTWDGLVVSDDETAFVSVEPPALVVRDAEGALRATLALDAGEESPCHSSRCSVPISISSDGGLVVLARNDALRVFDGWTGERLGRARVEPLTADLAISPDGTRLVHRGLSGTRTMFELPRLRVLSRWGNDGDMPRMEWVGERLVESGDAGIRVLSKDGAVLAEAADATGTVLVAGEWLLREVGMETEIRSLPDLTIEARLEGRVRAASSRGALLCRRETELVAATFADGAEPTVREVPGGCGRFAALTDDLFAGHDDDAEIGVRLVRLADGATLRIVGVERDGALELFALDDAGPLGETLGTFMLRRPTLTADGMIPAPAHAGSLAAWIAGP